MSKTIAICNKKDGVGKTAKTNNYGHTCLIEDMALAVINSRESMITGEEAKKSVDIILAIYESAKKGEEIFIEL